MQAASQVQPPKKKLRLLIYTTAFPPKVDGVANRARYLMTNLHRLGYEVLILCPYENVADEYMGMKIIKLPSFVPLWYYESKLAYPFPIITLNRAFRSFKPDLVHVIGPEFVFVPIVAFCWFYNVPLLGSYHWFAKAWIDNQSKLTQIMFGWILVLEKVYNFSDYVITPSYPMKEILNAQGMKCNDIWPPAVDCVKFNPSHYNRELKSQMTFGHPDNILLLFVGRVAIEKNLHLLPRILEENPEVYLAIIGAGDMAGVWQAKHGPEHRIFCPGEHWLNTKLAQAYASADIFIFPSNFETLGNVVIEAMASGVAVIGCNAGGVPHMIKDRENGLMFESGDQDGIARIAAELIKDSELRKRLAENGRRYAESINWEASSEYVAEIYERVYKMKKEGKKVSMTGKFPEDGGVQQSSLLATFLKLVLPFLFLALLIQFYFGMSK